jgi:hypothetical protein
MLESNANGDARSFQFDLRLPGAIRSNPRARAQFTRPARTKLLAWYKAVEPVEQLLFTLVMGMPVRPKVYRARCTFSGSDQEQTSKGFDLLGRKWNLGLNNLASRMISRQYRRYMKSAHLHNNIQQKRSR